MSFRHPHPQQPKRHKPILVHRTTLTPVRFFPLLARKAAYTCMNGHRTRAAAAYNLSSPFARRLTSDTTWQQVT